MHPDNVEPGGKGRFVGLRLLRAALRALVLAMAWQSAAMAAPVPLVTVSGAGGAPQILQNGEAAAIGFTLGQAYNDVTIGADLFCVACQGELFLMRGLIGPTSDLTNFVTGDFFDVNSTVDALLTGLDLAAGNYFLILAITDGGAGWNGTDPPDIAAVAGSGAGLNFFADALDTPAFKSDFEVILTSAGLHFAVSAIVDEVPGPSVVPIPPTFLLLLTGVVPVLIYRARKPVSAERSI